MTRLLEFEPMLQFITNKYVELSYIRTCTHTHKHAYKSAEYSQAKDTKLYSRVSIYRAVAVLFNVVLITASHGIPKFVSKLRPRICRAAAAADRFGSFRNYHNSGRWRNVIINASAFAPLSLPLSSSLNYSELEFSQFIKFRNLFGFRRVALDEEEEAE